MAKVTLAPRRRSPAARRARILLAASDASLRGAGLSRSNIVWRVAELARSES
jgi:hypothetical protein